MRVIPFNKVWDEWYCGLLVDKLANITLPAINYRSPTPIPTLETATANTGASGLYLSADTPHSDKNPYIEELLVVGNK